MVLSVWEIERSGTFQHRQQLVELASDLLDLDGIIIWISIHAK